MISRDLKQNLKEIEKELSSSFRKRSQDQRNKHQRNVSGFDEQQANDAYLKINKNKTEIRVFNNFGTQNSRMKQFE